MGKILVKSPSAAASLATSGLGNALQDAFKVKTPFGQAVGGALGGLTALTSLADASENQQDLLSGAQTAAGRGVGTYIGAGKAADAVAPAVNQAYDKTHRGFNKLRGVAPPEHRAQQIAVRRERAAQPAASPDFNVPENFQLGMLGTDMGGGNYVVPGKQGIQRNLFNPADPKPPTGLEGAGLGNVDPTMLSGDARAYGASGVPSMSMTEMGQMLPGVEQPPPPQSQTATIGSSQVGIPAQEEPDLNRIDPEELVAQLSPQGAASYFTNNNMKNAGEPMELAFRLLKSVMR